MHARATYFSKCNQAFSSYLKEGRAFGPHGEGLVIANSIENYDEEISLKLTTLTKEANLAVRACGFKPFIAPSLSSGAISLRYYKVSVALQRKLYWWNLFWSKK